MRDDAFPCGSLAAPPQKCVVTLFAARGPEEPLEPWRCVEAGGAGAFLNRGDAFWGLGARKFSMLPQGTQGIGHMARNEVVFSKACSRMA